MNSRWVSPERDAIADRLRRVRCESRLLRKAIEQGVLDDATLIARLALIDQQTVEINALLNGLHDYASSEHLPVEN